LAKHVSCANNGAYLVKYQRLRQIQRICASITIFAKLGSGMGETAGLVTNSRLSGGTWGMVIGHVAPEAYVGGTIALVHEGDSVTIDAKRLLIQLNVDAAEIEKRRAAWTAPAPRYTRGVLGKYFKLVGTASKGAVTD
jgi:dihydroxy-acid dehydratase